MKKRLLAFALTLAMALGLTAPAMAAEQTFSDVPESYWGFADIEAVVEAGYMKGVGGGRFSPENKVTAAQFLTLLGRLVFPDVKAEGADWYGPYVTAAKDAGLLTGTQVDTSNVEAEISRYDMAVILRAAAKKLGVTEKSAQSSEVADYGMIPTMYADSVLAVYGMGLIKGVGGGSFNGTGTMRRAEVATVIMRLARATGNQGGTVSQGTETAKPIEAVYSLSVWGGHYTDGVFVPGERVIVGAIVKPADAAPYGYDRSGFTFTSSDPSVLEVTERSSIENANWYVVAHKEGTATLTVTDPCGVASSKECKVVSAREGMALKTYTLRIRTAREERHSLRGKAYTEYTFIPNIPYKVYYSRDGGKTVQLVHEGIASGGAADSVLIELPEDSFYSKDAGFYVSAETVLNGQRLVTTDLRTDGRAFVSLVKNISEDDPFDLPIELAPPNGEKVKFTVKGAVVYGPGGRSRVGEGFTVQLHLKDGRVVGESVTDSSGNFSMECEVDAIDNGFDADVDQYYATAVGIHNGKKMECNGWHSGELLLWSLNHMGANPYNPGGGIPVTVD